MERTPVPWEHRELEALDTETLRALICTEDLDEGHVLSALRILSSREEGQQDRDEQVDEAWQRFQAVYCTPEGEGKSLYDSAPQLEQTRETALRTRRPLRRLPRTAAAVAAAVGVLVATTVGAQAMGVDLWGVVAQWSRETFRFVYRDDGGSSDWMKGREELEGTELSGYLPAWIPEGYAVEEVHRWDSREQSTTVITFEGTDMSVFYLSLDVFGDMGRMQQATFEKNDALVREQELSGGGTVYFYDNGGTGCSVYQTEKAVYGIMGDLSQESAIQMFESIE